MSSFKNVRKPASEWTSLQCKSLDACMRTLDISLVVPQDSIAPKDQRRPLAVLFFFLKVPQKKMNDYI